VKRLSRPLLAAALLSLAGLARADVTLLNASYDVARELYKDINPAFVAAYKAKTGETVTVQQSHGASSAQALSVLNGLSADVVTMNQATDIDLLAERGHLLPADWRKREPDNAAPYATTMVFLVRKGNPRRIADWGDLARPGVAVIIPNPKTAGNGRYSYLAAWAWKLHHGGGDVQARQFVTDVFRNVPVLDTGGRGATTTFTQRGIGDVLVTFENEVALIDGGAGGGQFDVVYPSESILAEPPVALVDKVVERKKTRKQAQAYLDFLWSPQAQDIIARHHLRPRNADVMQAHASEFRPIKTFTVDEVFGGWQKAQQAHFADGGSFDEIIVAAKKGAQ
jgi:sulfate transport system substrate-binding protein